MRHRTTALDSLRVSVDHVAEDQVIVVEREARAARPRNECSLVCRVARRRAHLRAFAGAALVEADAHANGAVALALGEALRGDLAQRLAFEVRQFQILEHDLDQFLEGDVGLVVVDAGAVAGLAVALALAVLAGLADDLAGLRCRRRPGRRPGALSP